MIEGSNSVQKARTIFLQLCLYTVFIFYSTSFIYSSSLDRQTLNNTCGGQEVRFLNDDVELRKADGPGQLR